MNMDTDTYLSRVNFYRLSLGFSQYCGYKVVELVKLLHGCDKLVTTL